MDLETLSHQIESISDSYASKFGIDRDADWYILKLQEELGELIQSYLMMIGQARIKDKTDDQIRSDFRGEVADVLCHTLLLAKHFDIDLSNTVHDKWLKWQDKP